MDYTALSLADVRVQLTEIAAEAADDALTTGVREPCGNASRVFLACSAA